MKNFTYQTTLTKIIANILNLEIEQLVMSLQQASLVIIQKVLFCNLRKTIEILFTMLSSYQDLGGSLRIFRIMIEFIIFI
jgi:hypothetical protein